jgi:hypothetical protein
MQPICLPFQHTYAGLLLLLACVLLMGPVHSALASAPAAQLHARQRYAAELHPEPLNTAQEGSVRQPPADLHLADLRPVGSHRAELHVADLRPAQR